ncbi:MAG: pseudouridine synthase [Candidatus Magasanikiibacteriota bacterium]
MKDIRLQKYIADQGICSRRKAEVLIAEGKVKVNGEIVKEMGIKIDDEKDKVEVETSSGENIEKKKSSQDKIYIAMNKPVDYICSADNEQGQTVLDLLTPVNFWKNDKQEIQTRVYPVGRLDKDSEGLILLTNDGELTNKLTHPKFEHEKEYEVMIDKPLSRDAKKVLAGGMDIDDGEWVKGIKIIKELNLGRRVVVTVILEEGKNRQIRKMFGNLGYHIISLKRMRIGRLSLGTLPVGRWRFVRKESIV